MFELNDIKESVADQLPKGWLNEVWINHSDLPDEDHPRSFRCGDQDSIECCHNYNFDDQHWQPVIAEYNRGFVAWEEDPVHLDMTAYSVFLVDQIRDVLVGRCPICGKVHCYFERNPDEWFGLNE
jgi:hypothetical protein